MSSERPPQDGPDEHPTLEIPVVKREQEQMPSLGSATKSSFFRPKVNEDASYAEEAQDVFGVFDGVGGSGGLGEIASRVAKAELSPVSLDKALAEAPETRKTALERLHRIFGNRTEETSFERHEVELATRDALLHLDQKIAEAADRTPVTKESALNPMGTTGIVGKIWKDKEGKRFLTLGNSGDSRAYLYRAGKLIRLTNDQSYVQILLDAHVIPDDQDVTTTITAAQVAEALHKHPDLARIHELLAASPDQEQTVEELRRIVTQYLGIARYLKQEHRDFQPDILTRELEKGDLIIMMTDGIHDNLLDQDMETLAMRFAHDPQGLAEALVSKADQFSLEDHPRAKPDDMTVVVKRVE